VMAPNVTAKGNQRAVVVASESAAAPVATPPPAVPAELVRAMQRVAAMQAEAIKSSTWVGKDFEKQARAMDAGEVPQGQIHGQATPEQAQALIEDGIGVMPLLIPVVPPEERN